MKPGLVVAIRVNPVDCQSVLALMDASGLPRNNQTFASMVSMALSGLLQEVRSNGVIDEPDPFLYWDQMGQYHKGEKGKGRSAIAETVRGQGKHIKLPVHKVTEEEVLAESANQMTSEQRQAGLRMKELQIKQEYAKDSWSVQDQEEWDRLYKIVFPEG